MKTIGSTTGTGRDGETPHATTGIFVTDAQGVIISTNTVFDELFCLDGQVIGRPIWEVMGIRAPERECATMESIRTKHAVHKEVLLGTAAGTDRLFRIMFCPVSCNGNANARMVAGSVTALDSGIPEVIEPRPDWKNSFDNIDDIITIHDMHHNIIYAKKTAREALNRA